LDEDEAYRYAVRLLERRPYTVGGISDKFRLRSLPSEIQQKVIQRLTEKKLLNDAVFAEAFVHFKTSQNWGPSKIRLELQKKRVPREIVDQVLQAASSPEKESQRAVDLLDRQKQRFLRKKEKKKGQRLQWALEFLVRKGYSYGVARLAVQEVFSYNPDLHDAN
jgi:regulatory protein